MLTFQGLKVYVQQDHARMQLGDAVKQFLTPEQIEDHNAWMRRFFGTSNLIKDGEFFLSEALGMVQMNPRTYANFKAAVQQKGWTP